MCVLLSLCPSLWLSVSLSVCVVYVFFLWADSKTAGDIPTSENTLDLTIADVGRVLEVGPLCAELHMEPAMLLAPMDEDTRQDCARAILALQDFMAACNASVLLADKLGFPKYAAQLARAQAAAEHRLLKFKSTVHDVLRSGILSQDSESSDAALEVLLEELWHEDSCFHPEVIPTLLKQQLDLLASLSVWLGRDERVQVFTQKTQLTQAVAAGVSQLLALTVTLGENPDLAKMVQDAKRPQQVTVEEATSFNAASQEDDTQDELKNQKLLLAKNTVQSLSDFAQSNPDSEASFCFLACEDDHWGTDVRIDLTVFVPNQIRGVKFVPPSPPMDVKKAACTHDSLTLSWDAHLKGKPTGFEVYYRKLEPTAQADNTRPPPLTGRGLH